MSQFRKMFSNQNTICGFVTAVSIVIYKSFDHYRRYLIFFINKLPITYIFIRNAIIIF